jgi:hypothetical protein
MLMLTLPLMVLIALAIKSDSSGPVCSLLLDAVVLLSTIRIVLFREGAR